MAMYRLLLQRLLQLLLLLPPLEPLLPLASPPLELSARPADDATRNAAAMGSAWGGIEMCLSTHRQRGGEEASEGLWGRTSQLASDETTEPATLKLWVQLAAATQYTVVLRTWRSATSLPACQQAPGR